LSAAGEQQLKSPILYSDHLVTGGNEMFAHACKLDGIIFRKSYVAINPKLYGARTQEVEVF
jgi:hypothetical protein